MSCGTNIQGGVDVINSPDIQFLTAASGNYTVPAGKVQLHVSMTSAGGGGGGVANANASGGAGSTGIFTDFFMTVTPGQVIAFTCGALGTGGAAGNNNGVAGGDTTFGSVTTKGGLAGNGSASGNAVSTATTATTITALNSSKVMPAAALFQTFINLGTGGAGLTGLTQVNTGGASPWAIAPVQAGPNAAGGSAGGYGGAGSGATSTTGGTFAGGDGSAGAIMVIAR